MVNCDIENAAVRQLQSGSRSKFGKAERLVIIVRRDRDPGGLQIVSHRDSPPDPDTADQDFSECEGVHKHLPRGAGQQNFGGRMMMRVGRIQMGNEDARVHRDHAGQSARRSTK